MPVAQAFASMSKYPGTRVGALILGEGFEVRSSGWNGAPRGSAADEDGRLEDRVSRLHWAVHAESNAIANAARAGVSTMGCVMVVTHTPCMACAKLIAQAGIKLVLSPRPDDDFAERWGIDLALTRELFQECNVQLVEINEKETQDVTRDHPSARIPVHSHRRPAMVISTPLLEGDSC